MSSHWCTEAPVDSNASVRCPHSGSLGKAVDLQTVKAPLTEGRAATADADRSSILRGRRARCRVFQRGQGAVRHGRCARRRLAKLPFGRRPVCYCFGESGASIRAEIEARGRSSAVEWIREQIAAGRCACKLRNPGGTWFIGLTVLQMGVAFYSAWFV